jgi:hypothetical protein
MAGCVVQRTKRWAPEARRMKYWLIGVTAALSLMAMAPERAAPAAAATATATAAVGAGGR